MSLSFIKKAALATGILTAAFGAYAADQQQLTGAGFGGVAVHFGELGFQLGHGHAVLLRGFGAVTVGGSVADAVVRAWMLERGARAAQCSELAMSGVTLARR